MDYRFQQILAFFILLAVLPLMLILAVINLLCHGYPLFYKDRRQGLNKKLFLVYKFRSMKTDCKLAEEFINSEEMQTFGKLRSDPRITAFGKVLRRFSLDELPQLWNAVTGDMALIGPRPIVEDEEEIYGRYSDFLHSVKPGLTGLWQVSGRNLLTYHRRIAINIYYIKHRSWKLDLWILYKTIGAVFFGKGAW